MAINDGRVVSNFIIQALKNNDITIYGDGTQTRSFQYIEDLVISLFKLMKSENNFLGPVNLGNPNEISIYNLASKIIDLTDSDSKVVFLNLPIDDPKRRNPDISLAKEKLDWSPTIGLDYGLKKTIEYFKKLDEKN